MEENTAQIYVKKSSGKFKKFLGSFFLSLLWATVFIIICIPFLLNVNNLPNSEKAFIGGVNLMRIVLGFGALSLIASYFFVVKQKGYKSVALFLWAFWILGTMLVLFISSENNGIQIYPLVSKNKDVSMQGVGTMLVTWPLLIWIYGVYFSRKIATQLAMNKGVATLLGIFLPVLSVLIYSLCLYRTKTREVRTRIMKVGIGVTVIVIFTVTSAYYYIVGTPEYSLYKLRRAIVTENVVEVEKYLDIDVAAKIVGDTSDQPISYLLETLNTSFLEIKKQNPDLSKDADTYVSTGLTGKLLNYAQVDYSNEEPAILLEFNSEGSTLLSDLTRDNVGGTLAIYFGGQLVSTPVIQSEITNGVAVVTNFASFSSNNPNWVNTMTTRINEEKNGRVNGLKIKKKEVDGSSAHVTVGIEKGGTGSDFDLSMARLARNHWVVNGFELVSGGDGRILPNPEGEKASSFLWKYKGKDYSLDLELYDSYYRFYRSAPSGAVFNGESAVGWQEKNNDAYLQEVNGDATIKSLAQSLKDIGNKHNFNDNQLAELVASFVQTIPYDFEKFNNREAGLNGFNERPTYPYEVLYDNKGVCQDKSYLAYLLLRELGFGASFFLFPEDLHIAVGVECPQEYSNYDSGYCFLETTSLGNKIGSTPSIIKESGIAASEIVLSDYGTDATEDESSPLGKIEVLNKTEGLVYTGIIDTVNTQKEIDSLLLTIRRMDRELDASERDLDSRDKEISRMVDKLDKLEKNLTQSNYDDYSDYFSKYKKAYSAFEKDRKAFNARIATRNQLNNKYNGLIKSFYQ